MKILSLVLKMFLFPLFFTLLIFQMWKQTSNDIVIMKDFFSVHHLKAINQVCTYETKGFSNKMEYYHDDYFCFSLKVNMNQDESFKVIILLLEYSSLTHFNENWFLFWIFLITLLSIFVATRVVSFTIIYMTFTTLFT